MLPFGKAVMNRAGLGEVVLGVSEASLLVGALLVRRFASHHPVSVTCSVPAANWQPTFPRNELTR